MISTKVEQTTKTIQTSQTSPYTYTDRQTDRQTDKQTDRKTDRQTDVVTTAADDYNSLK